MCQISANIEIRRRVFHFLTLAVFPSEKLAPNKNMHISGVFFDTFRGYAQRKMVTMAAFTTIPIDREKLVSLTEACRKLGIPYDFGEKAPSLTADPVSLRSGIDCSGFVRWVIYKATGGSVKLPDGSWLQMQFVKNGGFKTYGKAGYAANSLLKDNRVRIAFFKQKGNSPGHVWLILNGKTIESHGGKGVNRRSPITPVLLAKVELCAVLTEDN